MADPVDSGPQLLGLQRLVLDRRAGLLAIGAFAVMAAMGLLALDGGPNRGEADTALLPTRPSEGFLIPIDSSDRPMVERAIAALRVGDADRRRIRADVLAQRKQLAIITLWDWAANDGDAVTVTTAGVTQLVPITNTPAVVVLPHEGPGMIALTAVRDGQGGVTVSVGSADGPINLRNMQIGETIQVTFP